jgi:RPA family protein
VVYRARIPSQDVTVALKQPFPNKTVREKTVQRILNEAETWAKVDDHPYIASILDWGYDAIPWVAIEYVDGGAITDHIEEFSTLQRLWTAYAIVDAIAYANGQRGIVHHDLKPDNILLQTTSEGLYDVPKVVDWGLSRELIQHTGSVSQATPEYAAPEQFDALLPDTPVGVHTDVYQLGIVCYEILTGEHPDHLRGEVPPPTEMNPGIPEALDPIIMKSIAHQRDQRYDHSIQLRDSFRDVLRGELNKKDFPNNTRYKNISATPISSSNKSNPPASRIFATEFADGAFSYSHPTGDEEAQFVLMPTGELVNRIFVVGVLTEKSSIDEDVVRARIVDTTGVFVIYAGKHQSAEQTFIKKASTPQLVALTGKARTFQPEGGGTVYTSIRPMSINRVDAKTRDNWNVDVANITLNRLAILERILEDDISNEELRENIGGGAICDTLSTGVPLALEHYETSFKYIEDLRHISIGVLEAVAGYRDKIQMNTDSPDEGGEVDVGPFPNSSVSLSSELE